MKQVVAGVPTLVFKNCTTEKQVKIMTLTSYERKDLNTIHVEDVFRSEEFYEVESWILAGDRVELLATWDTFNSDGIVFDKKSLPYSEIFIVDNIVSPYAKYSNAENPASIGVDIKVVY